jgi:superfamily I DNA and/or RNA helicase
VQTKACAAAQRVTVGVISPYSRQVQLLRRKVEDRGLLVGGRGYDAERHGVAVEVHTVDGFQVGTRLRCHPESQVEDV